MLRVITWALMIGKEWANNYIVPGHSLIISQFNLFRPNKILHPYFLMMECPISY